MDAVGDVFEKNYRQKHAEQAKKAPAGVPAANAAKPGEIRPMPRRQPKADYGKSGSKEAFTCTKCGFKFSLDLDNHRAVKCPWCSRPVDKR